MRIRSSVLTLALVLVMAAPASAAALLSTAQQAVEDGTTTLVDPALWDAATAALADPPPADTSSRYDDPFFVGWSKFLPAVPSDFTASTERDCTRGSIICVDHTIREMQRRYDKLGCDHDAVFALTYLLTTEEYRTAATTDGFFDDPSFVNHEDAVFADFYLDAIDRWRKGQVDAVPPAWRIAFRAADRNEMQGLGDILLGMNAHVRRDLPFVLAAIGLTAPDGSSRKPDHDQVNVFLDRVYPTIVEETAKRHDPTIRWGDVPGVSIDNQLAMQIIEAWREEAWRNAERLTNATSDAERTDIANQIEASAAATALTIRDLFRYDGVVFDSSGRDSYCADWLATR